MIIWSSLFSALAGATGLLAMLTPDRPLTPILWVLTALCVVMAVLAAIGRRPGRWPGRRF